jgi:hypothetical protein
MDTGDAVHPPIAAAASSPAAMTPTRCCGLVAYLALEVFPIASAPGAGGVPPLVASARAPCPRGGGDRLDHLRINGTHLMVLSFIRCSRASCPVDPMTFDAAAMRPNADKKDVIRPPRAVATRAG